MKNKILTAISRYQKLAQPVVDGALSVGRILIAFVLLLKASHENRGGWNVFNDSWEVWFALALAYLLLTIKPKFEF